ncbi:hypothetical protein HID58_093596 [Brassica napus]|uniref:Uncharacterized protein n=1 Tax=Brassica napus TaxID=3708 RepID=A0ABQ7XAD0_BRANA|nr:hypothetical protein HID58_093596 [Brassica napus]
MHDNGFTRINSLTTIYKSPRRYSSNHKSPNQIKLVSNSLSSKPNTTQLPSNLYTVSFKTIGTGKLSISRYPDFEYSPQGGSGSGTARCIDADGGDKNRTSNSELSVSFDVGTLYIPSLTNQTTKFLGLPLPPPFLKIDIAPEMFQGTIDQDSGKVELEFTAKWDIQSSAVGGENGVDDGGVYRREEERRGERMDGEGKCRLVGVARVETVDDLFMNTFLSLPSECLADLQAVISVAGS